MGKKGELMLGGEVRGIGATKRTGGRYLGSFLFGIRASARDLDVRTLSPLRGDVSTCRRLTVQPAKTKQPNRLKGCEIGQKIGLFYQRRTKPFRGGLGPLEAQKSATLVSPIRCLLLGCQRPTKRLISLQDHNHLAPLRSTSDKSLHTQSSLPSMGLNRQLSINTHTHFNMMHNLSNTFTRKRNISNRQTLS